MRFFSDQNDTRQKCIFTYLASYLGYLATYYKWNFSLWRTKVFFWFCCLITYCVYIIKSDHAVPLIQHRQGEIKLDLSQGDDVLKGKKS